MQVIGGLGISQNIYSGGNVTATSFNATSDYRIKENIISLNNSTYNVNNLNPVSYFNTSLKKQDIGFIAHEVQEIYPFLVNGNKDDENYQSINYTGFIPILVKEIQLLKEENKLLKEEIQNIIQYNHPI